MPVILPPITPAHGMTLQDMIDQVSDEVRNKSIDNKITRWINMSIIELAGKYIFGTLHNYNSISTAIGVPDITLETDFYWLKSIQIPSITRKLYPVDEQKIADQYPNYRSQQGTVSRYYINGITLGLWYVPAAVEVITYSYQRRPIKLVNLATYCDLPADWHTLVTQKATTLAYSYESNTEAKLASQRSESILLTALARSIYRRPDEMIIVGIDSRRSGKPGQPKFPSSYPG